MKIIQASDWEATFAPDHGGQLVRLRHVSSGLDILNFPHTEMEFHEHSECYGIPVLFPPNRITDGRFIWEGRPYDLPLNETSRNNHLHGIVRKEPWQFDYSPYASGQGATVQLSFSHGPNSATYKGYPHCFRLEIRYDFSQDTIVQSIQLENQDKTNSNRLPFGLGFHTAFRVPEDSKSKTQIRITAENKCFELDSERKIPTGRKLFWPLEHSYYKTEGACFQAKPPLSCHCRAITAKLNGVPFRGAVIDYIDKGMQLCYEICEEFDYWFLWTPPGAPHVICIEPMTCMANAANIEGSLKNSGWRELASGKIWKAKTSLCLTH